MFKIIIVEDDKEIREELKILLENSGHQVKLVTDFENVAQKIIDEQAHLVLLDINLPGNNGEYICKEVRKISEVPIVMITSVDSELDQLISLNYGADDYITKPFNIQILLAKIATILKRTNSNNKDQSKIDCKDFILNLSKSTIEKEEKEIELTKNEFKIIYYLVQNRGKIVPREEIMSYLWDSEMFVDDNTLTVNIKRIRNKLEEHKLLRSTKLNEVMQGQTIKLGKNFKVEFIRSSHSIPDSVMLAITTPAGTVLHTGDFKVDYTPIDGKLMDFGRIAELGNKGILALMADSTNAERKGFTMSESSVGEVFDKLFLHCTKRIVVATFASNVHRVQQIVNSAIKYNRKIAVCGRSMINMIETARNLGYIECPENIFIDIDMINNYTDEQLVIITTGSQGEPMSALTRMAAGDHRKVKITPNDLVIISATPIPGNEKFVSKVIDDLMQIGAEVVYSSLEDIHVSGHACQEEQKLILALAKPKYFIPVHGEYRQLIAHSETAQSMGIDKDNIIMLSNGRVLEINENSAEFTSTVPSGRVLVDGLGVGDVGSIVLRDRQHLSQDGLIVIVLTMDSSTGEVIAGPDVISRGFVYVRESENLMDDVKSVVRHEIKKCEEKGIRDWSTIKTTTRENLRDYIFAKTKRNPMIIPIIMEV